MKKFMRHAILSGTFVVLYIFIKPTHAQQNPTVSNFANQITVRIEGAVQGSGVIINRKGDKYTVLTAWHVLSPNKPGEDIDIITSESSSYSSSIKDTTRLGKIDLATIEFTSSSYYPTAKKAKNLDNVKSDIIYVSGYPISKGLDSMQTIGNLVANAEVGIDQGYQLIYTNKTEAGMSGGPILNSTKELIGIHGRGEINETTQSSPYSIKKTNINLGIPIYFYEQHISGKSISPISQEASTWDDYYALFSSLKSRAQISNQLEKEIDLVPTELKLTEKMINIRPQHAEGYILKCLIEAQGSSQKVAKSPTCLQGLKLLRKYNILMQEAWESLDNNQQFALAKLDKASEIVSTMGVENYQLRANIIAGIGNPKDAIKIATKGLLIAEDLSANGVSLMFSRRLKESDDHAYDNAIISGLYHARGKAFIKTGDFSSAIKDLNAALDFNYKCEVTNSLPLDQRFIQEARILVDLASATLMKTRDKRPTCKIYSRVEYLNSKSKEKVNFMPFKKLCDEFNADKSSQPRLLTRKGMDMVSSILCSQKSMFDQNGVAKTGEAYYRALAMQSAPPIAHAESYIDYIKNDPELYSRFKSDDSLNAWARTIVYNSSKKCPNSFPLHQAPNEDWNWNNVWNTYEPRKEF